MWVDKTNMLSNTMLCKGQLKQNFTLRCVIEVNSKVKFSRYFDDILVLNISSLNPLAIDFTAYHSHTPVPLQSSFQ